MVDKFTVDTHFECFPFITQHDLLSHSIWVAETKSQSIGVTNHCFLRLRSRWVHSAKGWEGDAICSLMSIMHEGMFLKAHYPSWFSLISLLTCWGGLHRCPWPLGPWGPFSRCCHVSACPLGISVRLTLVLYVSNRPTRQSAHLLLLLLSPVNKVIYGPNEIGAWGSSPQDPLQSPCTMLPFLLSSHLPVRRNVFWFRSKTPHSSNPDIFWLYLKPSLLSL